MVERRKLVAHCLETRPICEAGLAIAYLDSKHRCGHYATDVHEPHTRARGGDILDIANTLTVCRLCHDWIHVNPKLATEAGLLKSGYGNH